MSEELRAALGAQVRRIEEEPDRQDEARLPKSRLSVPGRLIRHTALRSGRSRVTFDTQHRLVNLHEMKCPFTLRIEGAGTLLEIEVAAIRSVKISGAGHIRYTLIVDAQTNR